MNDQRQFLDAIHADPNDNLLRLAFADWLEEQGKRYWAGIIRQGVRLYRPPDELDRPFFRDHLRSWFFQPPDMTRLTAEMGYPLMFESNRLDRGLVAWLTLNAAEFLEVGPALAAWGPIPNLDLKNVAGHVQALAGCGALAAIRSVSFGGVHLTENDIRVLLTSPKLERLSSLFLGGLFGGDRRNALTAEACRLLARTQTLPALRHLSLSGAPVGDAGLATLAEGPALRGLVTLDLSRCRLTGTGLLAWGDTAPWPNLRFLNLGSNHLTPPGAEALARSPQLATLWTLKLDHTGFPDSAACILGQSPHPTQLRDLDLYPSAIREDGFIALAESPALAELRRLKLTFHRTDDAPPEGPIGPRGGAALGRPAFGIRLRKLNLAGHHIGDAGLTALAGSGRYTCLEQLDLSNNEIGDEGVIALTRASQIQALTSLSLFGNRIGSAGARALTDWPGLGRLKSLPTLARNPLGPDAVDLVLRWELKVELPEWKRLSLHLNEMSIGDEGVARLTAAPALSRCSLLHLMENGITARGARLLAECSALAGLERLDLGINLIGDEGAMALAGSCYLAGLKELVLGQCGLTDAGVIALADSPHLTGLHNLCVFLNQLTDGAAYALARASWPALERLDLGLRDWSGWSVPAREALQERFGDKVKYY